MAPACSVFNLAKNFPAECQADMNSPIHTMNHGTDIKTLKIAAIDREVDHKVVHKMDQNGTTKCHGSISYSLPSIH